MNASHVLEFIAVRIKAAGSQRALAEQLGISDAYLSDILHQRRPLSDEFLAKIDLERIVTFRRITNPKEKPQHGK